MSLLLSHSRPSLSRPFQNIRCRFLPNLLPPCQQNLTYYSHSFSSISQQQQQQQVVDNYYTAPSSPISSPISTSTKTHVATVSLVGPPNAGKSSLSNALIRHRVSAVSRKVNTTRTCPTGVFTHNTQHDNNIHQLLFSDTPGLVERAFLNSLGSARKKMSMAAWGTAIDSDFTLFVVDASKTSKKYLQYYSRVASQLAQIRHSHFTTNSTKLNNDKQTQQQQQSYISNQSNDNDNDDDDENIDLFKKLLDSNFNSQYDSSLSHAMIENEPISNCILVLNKSDITRPSIKLQAIKHFFMTNIPDFQTYFHSNVFFTSAFNGTGVNELRDYLLQGTCEGELLATPGIPHYDDDIDVIRQHIWEKLLHRIHKEVPYRCTFDNDNQIIKRNSPHEIYVEQVIRAPTKATVYMIVGKGGDTLRWIKESAEISASQVLGKRVILKLTVAPAKKRHFYDEES